MIKRSQFGKTLAAATITGGLGPEATLSQAGRTPKLRKNTLMHVGGDYHTLAGGPHADFTGKANLEYNLRHGVKHLTAQMRKVAPNGAWDSDELKRMKDNCDKAGVTLEAIRMDSDYIMLRKGSERDRRLDAIIGNIQKASQIHVKIITHHWTLIPIRRNMQMSGRGGAIYAAFKLEDNWKTLVSGAGRPSYFR
jgi:hypothetical protein